MATESITEGVIDPIGLPATVSSSYTNTKQVYDVAIGGEPFFIAASNKYPYRRITAPYKREQIDLTQSPGEQTLQGWWLRSQNSFHLGAGIKFEEPLQGQDVIYRFNKSVGLDPWTPGQVTLLPDVTNITSVSGSSLMVGDVDSSGNNVVIFTDGSSLKRSTNGGTVSTITYGGSGTILGLTSDGVNYYVATTTGIYMGTLAGTPTTTPIFTYGFTASNVVVAWVKQRLIAAVDNKVFQVVPIVTHTITATQLSNNIATVTFTPENNYRVGDPITVSGVPTGSSGTAYNGTWVVSAIPTSGSISYYHNNADLAYTTNSGSLVLTNNNSNPIYVHPRSTWKFTGITEGPTAIYLSGYAGTVSTIIKITLDSNGTVPALTSAVTAADFPNDEFVTSIGCYLGKFVAIGTNKGIRIGTIDSSAYGQGYITYGPLTYKKPINTNYVSNFAFVDRFAYATVTNDIDGKSGLLRIDLSQQVSDGKFAWTYDLNSNATGTCQAIALVGTTGRLAFIVNNNALYFQHATNLVSSGYLDTGAIRYNTLENKHFKRINVRLLSPVAGSVGISTIQKSGAVTSIINVTNDAIADQDIGTKISSTGLDQLALRFTLNRSSTDSTKGPTFQAYQLKSLIAMPRYRVLEIPIMNYDFESDRYNISTGYEGRAWNRLQALESIEGTGDTITFQDFTSGEQVECLIEQVSFERMSSPDRRFKGYGGIVYVQVRTV